MSNRRPPSVRFPLPTSSSAAPKEPEAEEA